MDLVLGNGKVGLSAHVAPETPKARVLSEFANPAHLPVVHFNICSKLGLLQVGELPVFPEP